MRPRPRPGCGLARRLARCGGPGGTGATVHATSAAARTGRRLGGILAPSLGPGAGGSGGTRAQPSVGPGSSLPGDPGRGLGVPVATSQDEAEIMRLLRRMKSQAGLLIALSDIGAVWPVMRVTAALTDLADAAVGGAVRYLLGDAARRGWLRPPDPAQVEIDSGYIVLAMGKMGAHELNYSIRHRSDRLLRRRGCGAHARYRTDGALCPIDASAGEASCRSNRPGLCVSHRFAAAAGSGLHPDRGLDGRGARLLRDASARTGSGPP